MPSGCRTGRSGPTNRIKEARCVTGAPIGDDKEILLIASMGGDVAAALDRVSATLLGQCLSRVHAVGLVRSTLAGLGVADPRVQATGFAKCRLDRRATLYLAHVDAGCLRLWRRAVRRRRSLHLVRERQEVALASDSRRRRYGPGDGAVPGRTPVLSCPMTVWPSDV